MVQTSIKSFYVKLENLHFGKNDQIALSKLNKRLDEKLCSISSTSRRTNTFVEINTELPLGWKRRKVQRESSAKTKTDWYVISEDGRKFRSQREIDKFIEERCLPFAISLKVGSSSSVHYDHLEISSTSSEDSDNKSPESEQGNVLLAVNCMNGDLGEMKDCSTNNSTSIEEKDSCFTADPILMDDLKRDSKDLLSSEPIKNMLDIDANTCSWKRKDSMVEIGDGDDVCGENEMYMDQLKLRENDSSNDSDSGSANIPGSEVSPSKFRLPFIKLISPNDIVDETSSLTSSLKSVNESEDTKAPSEELTLSEFSGTFLRDGGTDPECESKDLKEASSTEIKYLPGFFISSNSDTIEHEHPDPNGDTCDVDIPKYLDNLTPLHEKCDENIVIVKAVELLPIGWTLEKMVGAENVSVSLKTDLHYHLYNQTEVDVYVKQHNLNYTIYFTEVVESQSLGNTDEITTNSTQSSLPKMKRKCPQRAEFIMYPVKKKKYIDITLFDEVDPSLKGGQKKIKGKEKTKTKKLTSNQHVLEEIPSYNSQCKLDSKENNLERNETSNHDKGKENRPDKGNIVQILLKQNKSVEPEDEEVVLTEDEVAYIEEIGTFLAATALCLEPSPPTKGDGNCWFRAAAEQVVLHDISAPRDHLSLRLAVCSHVKRLPPQVKEDTINVVFLGKARGLKDLASRQRKPGQWVDKSGVMVLTTASFLGRDILIYGYGPQTDQPSVTRIEGGVEASGHQPLTIFFHDKHYQTLRPVQDQANIEEIGLKLSESTEA